MAQVYPFRAFRYNPERAPFDRVLTQPYDKISPAMQEKYYAADPHNLIAVEKGRAYPDDTPQNNVYTRAATRCVGKIVSPSLRVLTKVIITSSYGACGSTFPARVRRSLR